MPRPLRLGVSTVASYWSAGPCAAGDAAGEAVGAWDAHRDPRPLSNAAPTAVARTKRCISGKSLKLSTDESTHIGNRPYVAIARWCRLTSRLWSDKPTRRGSARSSVCMPAAKGSPSQPDQNEQNSKLTDGAYFLFDGYVIN